jgi:hypothetical protein
MSNGSWFNTIDQYKIFQASLERSQLIVKMAQAKRMESDIAALNEKYDGKKAAGIEDQINKIADQKFSVTNYLNNVNTGLKRIDDIRTQLLMAKDAIAKGSNSAFDLAVNSINVWIGRQQDDPDSIIANNTNGRGGWAKDVTVVSGGGMSINLTHEFMGSDYAVVLPDGQVLRPDKAGTKLTGIGNGGVAFSDLSMDRVANMTDASGIAFQGTLSVADVASLKDGDGTILTDADGNPIEGRLKTENGVTTLTANGKAYSVTYGSDGEVTLTDPDDGTNTFQGFVSVTSVASLQGAGGTVVTDGGNAIQGTLRTVGGQTTLTAGNGKTYVLSYSDQVRVTSTVADADGTITTNTYDGTLKKGGLGVLHSWSYGNFKDDADPDAATTARQAAAQDIDTAIRKLAQIERNLNIYEAGLSGISNGLDGKSSLLSTEYKKVSEEELNAKQAERRAIETRFNIATNAMALSNETTATFVYQMFVKSPTTEKETLTDILLGLAGG